MGLFWNIINVLFNVNRCLGKYNICRKTFLTHSVYIFVSKLHYIIIYLFIHKLF